jgi:hypothetical protein
MQRLGMETRCLLHDTICNGISTFFCPILIPCLVVLLNVRGIMDQYSVIYSCPFININSFGFGFVARQCNICISSKLCRQVMYTYSIKSPSAGAGRRGTRSCNLVEK